MPIIAHPRHGVDSRSGPCGRAHVASSQGGWIALAKKPLSRDHPKAANCRSGSIEQFGCDLSEVALKKLTGRLTSKLNTRIRFPSPAPVISVLERGPGPIPARKLDGLVRLESKLPKGRQTAYEAS
jgi:hypothetical protein